jgi:hypothetical protein
MRLRESERRISPRRRRPLRPLIAVEALEVPLGLLGAPPRAGRPRRLPRRTAGTSGGWSVIRRSVLLASAPRGDRSSPCQSGARPPHSYVPGAGPSSVPGPVPPPGPWIRFFLQLRRAVDILRRRTYAMMYHTAEVRRGGLRGRLGPGACPRERPRRRVTGDAGGVFSLRAAPSPALVQQAGAAAAAAVESTRPGDRERADASLVLLLLLSRVVADMERFEAAEMSVHSSTRSGTV